MSSHLSHPLSLYVFSSLTLYVFVFSFLYFFSQSHPSLFSTFPLFQMSVVSQLVEMGFDQSKAERAVSVSGDNLENAINWLCAHQDELMDTVPPSGQQQQGSRVTMVDEPSAASAEGTGEAELTEKTPGSYKCDDCGKLLRDQDGVMFHAAKTNHENFSESTETIKPMTAEERAVKAAELKERLIVARQQKEAIEKKEQIEKEKRRREEGKIMIERREEQKANELKQIVEDRKREKTEDQKAKQRILEQIKMDKEARKAKAQGLSHLQDTGSGPSVSVAPPPKVDYKQAQIQVRLPSGQAVRTAFDANEPLSAVRCWIEINHNPEGSPFQLMTAFPRKVMNDADYDSPLTALGLVPSAVLVMTRGA